MHIGGRRNDSAIENMQKLLLMVLLLLLLLLLVSLMMMAALVMRPGMPRSDSNYTDTYTLKQERLRGGARHQLHL